MPLDHYVSQVHLRKFYAADANFRKTYGYRKSDGAEFPCGSEDVCRMEEGSTNQFLTEPRFIEDFLRKVEPAYDSACDSITARQFTFDDILVIAGFASFVICCSPTAMRLGAKKLEMLTHTQVELMEQAGLLDPPPAELGGKSATELIQNGALQIEIDQKYPQAMGISNVVNLSNSMASFHWEILLNPKSDKFPFLSSDFPAAIERPNLRVPANRIVPLRPDLAVRIIPQIRPAGRPDMNSDFLYKIRQISPSEVRQINVILVQSAEDLVFAPVKAKWVTQLVKKNAKFRIELEHSRMPTGAGFFLTDSLVVKESQ
ncbi:MAG: DUF4238 domain-containing protein [Sphingorhabdus sp.]